MISNVCKILFYILGKTGGSPNDDRALVLVHQRNGQSGNSSSTDSLSSAAVVPPSQARNTAPPATSQGKTLIILKALKRSRRSKVQTH